jgi:hypothetical protein
MYYKGTEQECLEYDAQVTEGEVYPIEGDNWANPIERDGSWYILRHEKYLCQMNLVNELPQTPIEINDN